MKRSFLKSGIAAVAILATCPTAVVAQQDEESNQDSGENILFEEIVVTARFRAESAQDIGAAISALSGSQLAEQGINSARDLASAVPSLSLQDRGPGRNEISIRGIGRTVFQQDLTASAANIGVYIDDVPVNVLQGAQIDIRSFDLDRVEVLRGPRAHCLVRVRRAVPFATLPKTLTCPR